MEGGPGLTVLYEFLLLRTLAAFNIANNTDGVFVVSVEKL